MDVMETAGSDLGIDRSKYEPLQQIITYFNPKSGHDLHWSAARVFIPPALLSDTTTV